MTRLLVLAFAALFTLSACETVAPSIGADGQPLPKVYQISAADKRQIPYRMLDSINSLRQAAGVPALQLNADLTAAAATHSRDMSLQNRPWHFGSDGSSPLQRVTRTGYAGGFLGEDISETYETELETLSAWMDDTGSRGVILDPTATDMGFSWFQDPDGKIWWTLVTGGPKF